MFSEIQQSIIMITGEWLELPVLIEANKAFCENRYLEIIKGDNFFIGTLIENGLERLEWSGYRDDFFEALYRLFNINQGMPPGPVRPFNDEEWTTLLTAYRDILIQKIGRRGDPISV